MYKKIKIAALRWTDRGAARSEEMYREPLRCKYCGEIIENNSGIRCLGELVHADCLDDIHGRENLVRYMQSYPDDLVEFVRQHQADDFMDEFLRAFLDENTLEIERWSVS